MSTNGSDWCRRALEAEQRRASQAEKQLEGQRRFAEQLEKALQGEAQSRQEAEAVRTKWQSKADTYRRALRRSTAKLRLAERNAQELRTLLLELERSSDRAGELTALRLLQEENATLRSRVEELKAEKLRDIEVVAEAYLREREDTERSGRGKP